MHTRKKLRIPLHKNHRFSILLIKKKLIQLLSFRRINLIKYKSEKDLVETILKKM